MRSRECAAFGAGMRDEVRDEMGDEMRDQRRDETGDAFGSGFGAAQRAGKSYPRGWGRGKSSRDTHRPEHGGFSTGVRSGRLPSLNDAETPVVGADWFPCLRMNGARCRLRKRQQHMTPTFRADHSVGAGQGSASDRLVPSFELS